MIVSWVYLAVSAAGALLVLVAYRPFTRPPLHWLGFFVGWAVRDFGPFHIAWQLAATVAFVLAGALDHAAGWAGLALNLASWPAMAALLPRRGAVDRAFARGLAEGLGAGYRERVLTGRRPFEVRSPWRSFLRVVVKASPLVAVTRDVVYRPESPRGRLDVYAPAAGCSNAPVLMWIHAGAWTTGDKRQQGMPLMLTLAAHGWVCVAPNYSLSPHAEWPAHLVDLKAAVAWVKRHIAQFGGDPEFIVVCGGSAGGHLSAMLGLTAGAPEYQPGFEDADTSVQGAVALYPALDWTNSAGQWRNDALLQWVSKHVLHTTPETDLDRWRQGTPYFRIHRDAPPFLVIPGGADSFVSLADSELFVRELRAVSRAPVCRVVVPGAQHSFDVFNTARTMGAVRGISTWLEVVYGDYVRARAARPAQPAPQPS